MSFQEIVLPVKWEDLDLLGHVNNLAIVGYFQEARVQMAANTGMPVYPGMEFGPIEAATEIKFCKQIRYPGNVRVRTAVSSIGTTSTVLFHQVIDDAGAIAAEGREVIVYFDFQRQSKAPLPENVRQKLSGYLAAEKNISQ